MMFIPYPCICLFTQLLAPRSCVVIVHNLSMGEMNCERLFNLVCQYGNVSKIFFMKTKPGCAMIEMGDHEGAQRLVTNIQVS